MEKRDKSDDNPRDGSTTPPPCLIYVDREGKWYHKGAEIIRIDMIRMFCENMTLDEKGRYIITWHGKPCLLDVEDTAYVVRSVTWSSQGEAESGKFMLELNDGSKELLKPETLRIKEGNIPYCQIRDGAFPARFNRQAYYQLAQHIVEIDGRFYLPADGRRYPL